MTEIQPYRPLELMRNDQLTRYDFTDFIGVWENFVPKAFCDKLIEYFDTTVSKTGLYINPTMDEADVHFTKSEDQYGGNMNRKDVAFMLNYASDELTYQVNQFLKACAQHYIDEFSQLKRVGLMSTDVKFQRTSPGGGYHLWHYENASRTYSERELTWMIYLNDLPEGEGETEFLYQKRRIRPTVGTVVMFPAGMTHVHKGNTVFSKDKYIVTGWYIKTHVNSR